MGAQQTVSGVSLSSKQQVTRAVHKFGGSSLATAQRVQNVANIVANYTCSRDFIVVSANGDMTDWLLALREGKHRRDGIARITAYYEALVRETLADATEVLSYFHETLQALCQGQHSEATWLAHGELWSAKLLTACLNESTVSAQSLDAREILRTSAREDFQQFDAEYFHQGLHRQYDGATAKRLVVTGFIARNLAGDTITLGRNGSDYTASLLAYLSGATSANLWTDVPGIYTADPRLIKRSHPIANLSYTEASALAAVGTNVLHQKTIAPLAASATSLRVRSSLWPDMPGTTVSLTGGCAGQVRSVALKSNLVSVKASTISDSQRDLLKERWFAREVLPIMFQAAEGGNKECSGVQQGLEILVDVNDVSAVTHCFRELGLNFVLGQNKLAAIALVGEHIAERPAIISGLIRQCPAGVRFGEPSVEKPHLLYLVSPVSEQAVVMEAAYQFSFGKPSATAGVLPNNMDSRPTNASLTNAALAKKSLDSDLATA